MNDAETIKAKIDIVDFISQYISLKKAGRNFKAVCPFHNEKTPSFIVSPERQTWHCFGACGEGGDAIKFLQKWENLEFPEALKILAQKTGVKLERFTPSDESRFKDKLLEINHLSSEYYHYLLVSHLHGQKAMQYLKDRKIKEETIKTFMLGYSPNSWDSLMKYLMKKGYDQKDIYLAGLLVKTETGRYYDRFRGRLMFTLKDHLGNSVGFSGRTLPPGNEKDLPREAGAKYINTNDTSVYVKGNVLYGLDLTKGSIKKNKEAVVVEGEFDFLASFQSGVPNVVAIKGTALTEGQIMLLKRYTENLVLSLDSDFAGQEAAKRGIDLAEEMSLNVRIIKLPYGKDPAECIDHDPHLWKEAVKDAVPVYDFIINNALAKYGKEGVVGKKKISSEVIPYLNKITNPIIISHYVKYLSRQLGVNEESVELTMRKQKKEEKTGFRTEVMENLREPRETLLDEYLLSLVIQSEDVGGILDKILKIVSANDLNQSAIRQIFEKLELYFKTHKTFEIKKFTGNLTQELLPAFDKAYMLDIENILKDRTRFQEEIATTAREIVKLSLRRRMNIITTKIKQNEDKGEEKANTPLSEELKSLLSRLNEVDKSVQTN